VFEDIWRFSSVVNFPPAAQIMPSGDFGERDVDRRRSGLFERVRNFREFSTVGIFRVYGVVNIRARNDVLSGCIVTAI